MMRIDKIADRADRSLRYAVTFSDGSVMRLYRQTVEDFGLYTGLEMDDDSFKALKAAAGKVSAKMRAVRIVTATGVSKADLERRLVQKGEDPSNAREAVAWMSELNLVDDRQTAAQIVARCAAKGYGIERAKQALYEKRIPRNYWDDALEAYPEQSQFIRTYLETKLDNPADRAAVRKVVDALLRRGHRYSEIRSALNEMRVDAPDEG